MTLLEWLLRPILNQLYAIENSLALLHGKVDHIMTAVQIQQEALDEYAGAVDQIATEIGEDIEALKKAAEEAGTPLPEANVDALQASLSRLQGLDQPDVEQIDEGEPHVDNTLPGDLPAE